MNDERKVQVIEGAPPIQVPAEIKTLSDSPIAGGQMILNGGIDCGEPGHQVWRRLTKAEEREARETRTLSAGFHRADGLLFLRLRRDALLRATDWIEANLINAPLLPQGKWAMWRQQLRDLPATVADPEFPEWPEPPSAISALLEWRSLWPDLGWDV